MPSLRLLIGNKNYSSWSMRPWLLLHHIGVPFRRSGSRSPIRAMACAGGRALAECPRAGAADRRRRRVGIARDRRDARRSVSRRATVARGCQRASPRARDRERDACGLRRAAQAHAVQRRRALPGLGMTPEVQRDIDRIVAIWTDRAHASVAAARCCSARFGIADAMYAPVVLRFVTYGVELPRVAAAYAAAVQALPGVRAWTEQAAGRTVNSSQRTSPTRERRASSPWPSAAAARPECARARAHHRARHLARQSRRAPVGRRKADRARRVARPRRAHRRVVRARRLSVGRRSARPSESSCGCPTAPRSRSRPCCTRVPTCSAKRTSRRTGPSSRCCRSCSTSRRCCPCRRIPPSIRRRT